VASSAGPRLPNVRVQGVTAGETALKAQARMAMKHTIIESWDFMDRPKPGDPETIELYGVRWTDGYERLFADMPEQQTRAYIRRAGIKDLMGHTKGKADN
jgi:hypothetical protein